MQYICEKGAPLSWGTPFFPALISNCYLYPIPVFAIASR